MPSIPRRPVSGRYRGRNARSEIELRVDVDGTRALQCVSADYFDLDTHEPQGSMRMDAPVAVVTPSQVIITGTADFTWPTQQRHVTITITHVAVADTPLVATISHRAPLRRTGPEYHCTFESPFFRTVLLGEAVQRGVTKLESYDTGLLPSGGPPRTLAYVDAFAEAGIEMQSEGAPAIVETEAAGADVAWSDAELQAAMEQNFARWIGHPRWAVWLMHATRHDNLGLDGPHDGLMQGIMFDRRMRQGCAIFYDIMPGDSAAAVRDQLYTCVHELAHGFNLRHSWERADTRPPIPSRPAAASWMNYPSAYPGGRPAFWADFSFEFDDDELAHLRHALRDDIIMGATPFETSPELMREAAAASGGESGLRLTLRMAPSFAYGVPVTADLELAVTAPAGRTVQTVLGPRSQTTDIAIAQVGGMTRHFEPLLRHCRGGDGVLRHPADPPIRDAALLHYGSDGHPFSEPGLYDVQARHVALDGSSIVSDVVRIRVLEPRTATERALGELVYGTDETGALLSLMGSDAPELARGNEALREIIVRFPRHPMASIARLVRATNVGRAFKLVASDGAVAVRPPQPAAARALVDPVVDVARLNRAAAQVPADVGRREALAIALAQVGTRRGVSPAVAAFLRTRVGEFAMAVPAIAAAPAPSSQRPPPPDPSTGDVDLKRQTIPRAEKRPDARPQSGYGADEPPENADGKSSAT